VPDKALHQHLMGVCRFVGPGSPGCRAPDAHPCAPRRAHADVGHADASTQAFERSREAA
jgi:hypothetical protein